MKLTYLSKLISKLYLLGTAPFVTLLSTKLLFFPDLKVFGWLFVAVLVDLFTGLLKVWAKKEFVTSKGLRQTAVKAIQYTGLLLGGIIIGNTFEKHTDIVKWVNDGMLLFLIYVEVYSIFENLRDMNPDSIVSNMVFKPILSILTLGLQRLSLQKPAQPKQEVAKDFSSGTTTLIILLACTVLFSACRVVRPGENTSYSKTDTTVTTYKPVDVSVKGGTVANAVNIDSLFIAWKKSLPAQQQQNADSLYKAFIKTMSKDTVTVTDPQSKAQLKYWYDEYGKLQMSCTAKDQTVQMMVAEITRLTQEVTKKATVEVVYKMPWWGWILAGGGLFSFVVYNNFKSGK